MHGFPLAKEIVEQVIHSTKDKKGKVTEIEVEMGPDSTIDAEELELCYNIASEETAIKGSKINIILKHGQIECIDCGHKEKKKRVDRIPTCSKCYSTNIKIEDKGIIIKSIEFEEETI